MPSLPKQGSPALQVLTTPVNWTLSIDDGTTIHQLSLEQAMKQGYNFLTDGHNLIFQVAFTATGVVSYKVGEKRTGMEGKCCFNRGLISFSSRPVESTCRADAML